MSALYEFCIVSDGDHTNYVIPYSRTAEWEALWEDVDEDDDVDVPDWAVYLNGPVSQVLFTGYRLEG